MLKLRNRTYHQTDCPKSTILLFEFIGFFKEALFQFLSFFMLLYVELASSITKSSNFTTLFFLLSMCLIGSKIIAAFCWPIASHFLEYGRFKYGRFRSMTFLGATLTTFFSTMTFFVAPLFGDGIGFILSFLIFYTLSECSFSINDIAFWSYVNKMSYDADKRNRIVGITNFTASAGSYLVTALSPSISAGNAKQNMTILFFILILLFYITQFLYCLFMYEREEDNSIKIKKSVLDPFKLVFQDRQIMLVILAYFLIYIAQDLFIGNTSSLFYYEYGYGGFNASGDFFNGGTVYFFFSLCFGSAFCLSCSLFPILAKRFKNKTMLFFNLTLCILLFSLTFFFGMRKGFEYLLFVLTSFTGFSFGTILMILNMNVVNVAEYYQAKTSQERSAAIQSIKAFAVKLANATQTGLFYLFLAISPNLLDINQKIANLESLNNQGLLKDDIIYSANQYISSFENLESSLTIYRSSVTLLPMVLTLCAVILSTFVYVLDEKKYEEYVRILKEKKQS